MGEIINENEKVFEIVIKRIKEENIYSEKEISKILKQIENTTIDELKLESNALSKRLKNNNIIILKQLFNLKVKEAARIMILPIPVAKNYLNAITIKIKNIIIQIKNENEIEKQVKIVHPELIKLIADIIDDQTLKEFVKEEIIYAESKNENEKNWKYSKHNLTKQDLKVLKKYLKKEITLEKIEKIPDKHEIHKSIINIYKNLTMYTYKLKYKYILNENYYEIESINLKPIIIRSLKRNNIFLVSELIEYNEKELQKLNVLGPTKIEEILKSLKERNIIILDEKEKIIENLKQENANIKPKEKKLKKEKNLTF